MHQTHGANVMKRRVTGFLAVGVALLFTGTACTAEPEPQSAPAPADEIQVVLRGIAATPPPELAPGKAPFEQNCGASPRPPRDGSTSGPPPGKPCIMGCTICLSVNDPQRFFSGPGLDFSDVCFFFFDQDSNALNTAIVSSMFATQMLGTPNSNMTVNNSPCIWERVN